MKREETTISNIEFETADGRFGTQRSPIDLIVLHSTAGTLQSTISLFGSAPQAGKETSAHYVIENDGRLYQGLEEYYTAYHCGNLEKNKRSIGIEHVDNGANVRLHTDAQYTMSARLVRDICQFYNIPIDSAHIVPHSSIVATACPNGLDVERIIREAKGEVVVDDCPAKLLEKTKLETDLRGVITHKDELLQSLQDNIGAKNSQIATLENKSQELSNQLTLCQNSNASYLEIAKKVPEMENLIKEQEKSLQSLKGEITNYQKTIGAYKERWTLLKWSLKKLIIEKVLPI